MTNLANSAPINFSPLVDALHADEQHAWASLLPEQFAQNLCTKRFGDIQGWYDSMALLPKVKAEHTDFVSKVEVGLAEQLSKSQLESLEKGLRGLIPWRKGPFDIFGIHIDTEWRSDWKWDRLKEHISTLKDRKVLDVGCGSGYHCWRMWGAGAQRVIGIDPSPRFVVQFYMLKGLVGECPVDVLPLGIEALPPKLGYFDTTFSMGVLYHRRSPIDHLLELRDTLRPGGELILETLVIDGKLGEVLVPEDRYAKMNNVWFIPSVPTLIAWMKKCGYKNVRCVDSNHTTTDEQRSTDWMKFHSLKDFLDPHDSSKTFEGHPAPLRAVIIANTKG